MLQKLRRIELRVSEKIQVANDVFMLCGCIRSNSVRVSFLAPKNIAIWREKVFEQVAREQKNSCSADTVSILTLALRAGERVFIGDDDNRTTVEAVEIKNTSPRVVVLKITTPK